MLSSLRIMTPDDIRYGMELSAIANWNQTDEDWRRVMQLHPDGCRCIEDAGSVVATTSLLPYGTKLAWIGMVLTRPAYRRQGLARRLMEDAIVNAEQSGVRTLKLDATDEGRPLYESLDFVVEQAVERWWRDGGGAARETFVAGKVSGQDSRQPDRISDDLLALDEEAFGASRRSLLEALLASGKYTTAATGYCLSRAGRTAQYLGPCVVSSEADARGLIAAQLEEQRYAFEQHKACNWYWDLLPANEAAVRCAKEFGFIRRRTLWRMSRGETIKTNDAMTYAIAGFELG